MPRLQYGVAAALWILGGVGPVLGQVVVYDSGGFEAPRFSPGPLAGQDNWMQVLGGTSSSSAVIQSTTSVSGQAVQVNRVGADGDSQWRISNTVVSPTQIDVRWDMMVTPAPDVGQSAGPFFGASANGTASPVARLAMFGVDSHTGDLLYLDPTNGFQQTTPRTIVSLNVFHNYDIQLMFNGSGGGTYKLFFDGLEISIANNNFYVNSGNTDFTRAYINAFAAQSDGLSQSASGLAYFDNYSITATPVPEPATFALTSMAIFGVTVWRRRCAKPGDHKAG
jgi:hypothetical protein